MLWERIIRADDAQAACKALTEAWNHKDNKVFVLRADEDLGNVQSFYDAHFPHLGTPVALAEDVEVGDRDNQRTGQIWMEVRYDPKHPDAYRHSSNAQPLHTDGSYIPEFPNATLMACVANSGTGGETTFIDGEDVVAALKAEAPELLIQLQGRMLPHARSGDRRDARVIDPDGDQPLVNWNYYCVDKDIDAEGREIAESFFAFLANSPTVKERTLAVKLAPGDAITWKDRYVLHGRNGFVANHESERFLWKCAIDIGNFNG